MKHPVSDELKMILNPYLFVLKEKDDNNDDPMDYSLQMLQVGRYETLHSPGQLHFFPLLNSKAQTIPTPHT